MRGIVKERLNPNPNLELKPNPNLELNPNPDPNPDPDMEELCMATIIKTANDAKFSSVSYGFIVVCAGK